METVCHIWNLLCHREKWQFELTRVWLCNRSYKMLYRETAITLIFMCNKLVSPCQYYLGNE